MGPEIDTRPLGPEELSPGQVETVKRQNELLNQIRCRASRLTLNLFGARGALIGTSSLAMIRSLDRARTGRRVNAIIL